jgi:1-acyl-sn-glycerol-3-phosphate acyltransferase
MKYISIIILKIIGWKLIVTIPEPQKSVICVAPHTSNIDFFIGHLFNGAMGRKTQFLIKASWFFFPINLILRAMGGIPVDRSKKNSVTDQMAQEFENHEVFHLAITPEGTRSLVEKWKLGFYYIAVKANVPIQLGYIDYAKKEMGITDIIYPSGDEAVDLERIYRFYKGVTARHPKKFFNPIGK